MRKEKEIRNEIERYESLISEANKAYYNREIPRYSFIARLDCYNHKLNTLKWVVGDRDTTEE